jgi:hypothetical protein
MALGALAAMLATGAAMATARPAFNSTRTLLARIRAAGRAEATVETAVEDPLSGKARTVRGRLALELPHFARLELPEGETLTLREDGGDWLQPRNRQLVRSGPSSAAPALRWSALLLESGSADILERALGARGYELVATGADSASAERQRVWLGAQGYPVRLEIVNPGGERRVYRLSGWRFARARGRAAFVLRAPPGFEAVDLP